MIRNYDEIWPDHPYIFQVPYQDLPPTINNDRVQYHQCPQDIKGTVLKLIENLDDEEMIYWCIDDKYPIKLDIKKVEEIHEWLLTDNKENISGVLFCRCRGMLKNKNLIKYKSIKRKGEKYIERKNYQQICIHQYVKVKVIL